MSLKHSVSVESSPFSLKIGNNSHSGLVQSRQTRTISSIYSISVGYSSILWISVSVSKISVLRISTFCNFSLNFLFTGFVVFRSQILFGIFINLSAFFTTTSTFCCKLFSNFEGSGTKFCDRLRLRKDLSSTSGLAKSFWLK